MPDYASQVYWHEIDAAFSAEAVRARAPAQRRSAQRRSAQRFSRLRIDAALSPVAALDEVLASLRQPPVREAELAPLIADAAEAAGLRQQLTQSQRGGGCSQPPPAAAGSRGALGVQGTQAMAVSGEPPLFHVLKGLFEGRGFAASMLPKGAFHDGLTSAGFFSVHHNVAFVIDKEAPIFTTAYAVPVRPGIKGAFRVELLCPVRDPVPFRLRTASLTRLSYGECIVLCVSPDGRHGRAFRSPTSRGRSRSGSDTASSSADGDRCRRRRGAADSAVPAAGLALRGGGRRRSPPAAPVVPDRFAELPAVEAGDRHQRRRGVRDPWYLRLLQCGTRLRFRVLAQREIDGGLDDELLPPGHSPPRPSPGPSPETNAHRAAASDDDHCDDEFGFVF